MKKVSFKKASKQLAEDKVAIEEKAFCAACEKEAQAKEIEIEINSFTSEEENCDGYPWNKMIVK